jgi:hypothetical protein
MLDGYYWYVPAPEDRKVYPDLDEPQPVQVSRESVYLCGSDVTYDFCEFKGQFLEIEKGAWV